MSEEPKKAFDQWYDANKAKHNEKRRKRYQRDPDYQNKVKERARIAAAKRRAASRGVITRVHHGETVQVFRISAVAELCGVTTYTLKRKEQAGEIPACTFEGTHRVYTANQRDLLISYIKGDLQSSDVFEKWEL